ncbi:hypothetical protein ACFO9Q_05710 [Paenibacillus sp. GCM10023252]|uniref:hypothetical protein n=1 Tax=Paenibacillus sp. GCM10023252 TaxID=3252649 RepID=UPI0036075037
MNKRSVIALTIAAVLTLTAAAGCSNSGNNNGGNQGGNTNNVQDGNTVKETDKPAADPFSKYDSTVEMSVIYQHNAESEKKFIEGSTYEDNWFNDLYLEDLNIKPKVKWTAPAGDSYKQKYNLMIASNDLADVFSIEGSGGKSARTILKELVEAGQIEDLSKVYEEYASDSVKSIYNSFDNGKALENASVDGKLYALPAQGDTYSQAPVLWVRQDWLDKLSLPAPRTLEELITVARSFVNNDPDGNSKKDTMGLAFNKDIYAGAPTDGGALFYYNNSYPKTWLNDSSGQVVWGGIQPETKSTLSILADMYKEGLLNDEFAQQDGNKNSELITSGKIGMTFASWWSAYWPLGSSIDSDPKADWRAYTFSPDGTIRAAFDNPTNILYVVRKGYEHPEALVKLLNVTERYKHDNSFPKYMDHEQEVKTQNPDGKTEAPTILPAFSISSVSEQFDSSKKFQAIIEGKATEEDLTRGEKDIWKDIKLNQENPKKVLNAYKVYINWIYALGSLANAKMDVKFNAFQDTTPTYDDRMGALNDKQLVAFTKIIMGKEPVDYFDTFVKEWKEQGGDQITKEINEVVQKNK